MKPLIARFDCYVEDRCPVTSNSRLSIEPSNPELTSLLVHSSLAEHVGDAVLFDDHTFADNERLAHCPLADQAGGSCGSSGPSPGSSSAAAANQPQTTG